MGSPPPPNDDSDLPTAIAPLYYPTIRGSHLGVSSTFHLMYGPFLNPLLDEGICTPFGLWGFVVLLLYAGSVPVGEEGGGGGGHRRWERSAAATTGLAHRRPLCAA